MNGIPKRVRRPIGVLLTMAIGIGATLAVAAPSQASQTVELSPSGDTFVNSRHPNRNYGSRNNLQVYGSPVKRAFAEFDLAELEQPISKAVLTVRAGKSGGQFTLFGTPAFDERSLTYGNQPSPIAVLGSVLSVRRRQTVSVDVTDYARLLKASGGLAAFSLVTTSSRLTIHARENSSSGIDLAVTLEPPSTTSTLAEPVVPETQATTTTTTTTAQLPSSPVATKPAADLWWDGRGRPFSDASPFNTPSPSGTQWFDTPTLHTLNVPLSNGDSFRHWWVNADAAPVWYAKSTDPLWTFVLPDYIHLPANRNRSATTFQVARTCEHDRRR